MDHWCEQFLGRSLWISCRNVAMLGLGSSLLELKGQPGGELRAKLWERDGLLPCGCVWNWGRPFSSFNWEHDDTLILDKPTYASQDSWIDLRSTTQHGFYKPETCRYTLSASFSVGGVSLNVLLESNQTRHELQVLTFPPLLGDITNKPLSCGDWQARSCVQGARSWGAQCHGPVINPIQQLQYGPETGPTSFAFFLANLPDEGIYYRFCTNASRVSSFSSASSCSSSCSSSLPSGQDHSQCDRQLPRQLRSLHAHSIASRLSGPQTRTERRASMPAGRICQMIFQRACQIKRHIQCKNTSQIERQNAR